MKPVQGRDPPCGGGANIKNTLKAHFCPCKYIKFDIINNYTIVVAKEQDSDDEQIDKE